MPSMESLFMQIKKQLDSWGRGVPLQGKQKGKGASMRFQQHVRRTGLRTTDTYVWSHASCCEAKQTTCSGLHVATCNHTAVCSTRELGKAALDDPVPVEEGGRGMGEPALAHHVVGLDGSLDVVLVNAHRHAHEHMLWALNDLVVQTQQDASLSMQSEKKQPPICQLLSPNMPFHFKTG
eukprot:1159294-Pelagomonas_calceolata.AAC.5